MTTGLARIGDTILTAGRDDAFTILAHFAVAVGGPAVGWWARFVPRKVALGEPFDAAQPYDFTERDIVRPGALIGFADPWSTWTEDR